MFPSKQLKLLLVVACCFFDVKLGVFTAGCYTIEKDDNVVLATMAYILIPQKEKNTSTGLAQALKKAYIAIQMVISVFKKDVLLHKHS